MAITTTTTNLGNYGSWQEVFESTSSDRVKMAVDRSIRTPGICLEHALIEMEVYDEMEAKNIPRVLQRAKIFERFLEKKTIFITDGELIVGNMNSKQRGSSWIGELYNVWIQEELDDPVRDPAVRMSDRHDVSDEERKILKEKIIPYFKGKTFEEYLYSKADEDVREKGYAFTASCPHIPNTADLLVRQDPGHMQAHYAKVLRKGLKGIREEVIAAQKECIESFNSFERQARLDWYEAALISIDAVINYCKRYSKLALEMAAKEDDKKREKELLEIARICNKVPENPAETWHEALQAMWFIQLAMTSEQINYGNSYGRFDQYMFPFYKKSVEEDKSITRDEALELLELFWVKNAEFTQMYDQLTAQFNTSFPISQTLIIGGMLPDGTDGCNELTMLCLEADEQTALIQPELAMRIWKGTPDKYLRKACEVVRLGRGKPKFFGDKMAIQMMKKAYPHIKEADLADYSVIGCVEIALPNITMEHSFTGLSNIAKIMELTINNGRCSICGQQIGPTTGDPRNFQSIEAFKQAFRKQVFYWQEYLAKAMKAEMEAQAERLQIPFNSCLIEGPIPRGKDLQEGGAWYTHFGALVGGMANAADSFGVIDTLIYKEKKITWDELLKALADNWEGHEELRQMCINEAPKYGNDDDYADAWAAFAMDTWYDAVDYTNTQKEFIPWYGGQFTGAVLIGNGAVGMGVVCGALPEGHINPNPVADVWSPVQGRDVNGTSAVIKSITKLPAHRFEMGTALNQRLTPQMLATDEDITRFMDYLRAGEELGLYHVQFNVINGETLKEAMKNPDKYKGLLVRVASYVAYFTELDPVSQMDIINRTEQAEW